MLRAFRVAYRLLRSGITGFRGRLEGEEGGGLKFHRGVYLWFKFIDSGSALISSGVVVSGICRFPTYVGCSAKDVGVRGRREGTFLYFRPLNLLFLDMHG